MAQRWGLRLGPPFASLELNYVAPAIRADGIRCVLKVSSDMREMRAEMSALRIWGGRGAARVLEADPEVGALLIELLEPGTHLTQVAESDDDAATRIAADLLRTLWVPIPPSTEVRPLEDWCAAYERNRPTLLREDVGFPRQLFRQADALRQQLLASSPSPVLLHGDLHHFNVVRHQHGWRAIDPKGLAGDRCFDVCQFLMNPRPMPLSVNRRRLEIFCSELGLDRQRTRDWCLVHAVLNSLWEFEAGRAWQEAVSYAEQALLF
jgi:streptomycin 6-kinase